MKKSKILSKLKKIVIVFACVIFTMFSMPAKSKAWIVDGFIDLLLYIPDGIMWVGNKYLADRNLNKSVFVMGLEGVHGIDDDEARVCNFMVTPYNIFTNGNVRTYLDRNGNEHKYRVLPMFYANFFKTDTDERVENDQVATKTNEILRPVIANVYKVLRNLSILLMMLVLLYTGIKIIVSSAKEQSKYKQMLVDWVIGLCLLFVMHYIMSFVLNFNDVVVDMLKNDESDSYYISFSALGDSSYGDSWDEFFNNFAGEGYGEFLDLHMEKKANNESYTWYNDNNHPRGTQYMTVNHTDWGDNGIVRISALLNAKNGANKHKVIYRGNLAEYLRTVSSVHGDFVFLYRDVIPDDPNMPQDELEKLTKEKQTSNVSYRMGYGAMYLAIVIETIMFSVIYFKRVLQLAFLTMIAPLVAFMYPLDKMGDGQAQAFNKWLKDYIFNALLQPLHILIYTIFITASMALMNKNMLFAIALYAFMIPSEKYIKNILGFEKASTQGGGPLGGAFGGPLAMEGFRALTGLGPRGHGGKGGGGSGDKERRKPKYRTDKLSSTGPQTGNTPSGADGNIPGAAGGAGRFGRLISGANAGRGGSARQGGSNVPGADSGSKMGNRLRALGDYAKSRPGKIGRTIAGVSDRKWNRLTGVGKTLEVAKGIVGKGGRIATRAGLSYVGAVSGGMIGAATAMATGDWNQFVNGAKLGAVTGLSRGGDLANVVSTRYGNMKADLSEAYAEYDQEYKHSKMADQAYDAFVEKNKYKPTDEQREMIDMFAGYMDLSDGNEKKIDNLRDGYDYYKDVVYAGDADAASKAAAAAYADEKAREKYSLNTQDGRDTYYNDNKDYVDGIIEDSVRRKAAPDIAQINNKSQADLADEIRQRETDRAEKIKERFEKKMQEKREEGANQRVIDRMEAERDRQIADLSGQTATELGDIEGYRERQKEAVIAKAIADEKDLYLKKVARAKYK